MTKKIVLTKSQLQKFKVSLEYFVFSVFKAIMNRTGLMNGNSNDFNRTVVRKNYIKIFFLIILFVKCKYNSHINQII